ncbi:exodeoxyribonuclease VII large subunit [Salinimicrobium flavum]|uniref:Exodeoxyribonuclease 7 large subunit n=1 Tax=Salinimicrobium flavum TaxID=1737065 RepID=A0ABW5IZK9_9FLAO
MEEKTVYTLSQLTRSVQNAISRHCSKVVWIKAEIVKLNYYSKSGHCYPALVEKKDGKVIAEMRGNIWSATFDNINQKFRAVLKEELKDDMTVVIQGSVTFHPVHGLALNIIDIDPAYTLGELAREKAETIEKLKADQLFNANKKTSLPLLPKTIAIVSVETSKGYQDFLNVINSNTWGYKFHHLLFPAILQGDRAVSTISMQLEKISGFSDVFDAVAIIRGGGGEIGLSCFDDYGLAKKIAKFPIPVLTGIGHSTNETVSELVSYESFITPTKIAEFLLQKFHDFSVPVHQAGEKLDKEINWLFRNQKTGLQESARLFNSLTNRAMDRNKVNLDRLAQELYIVSKEIFRCKDEEIKQLERSILSAAKNPFKESLQKLQFSEEKLRLLSPDNVLKRGYSITRQNGKAIKQPEELDPEKVLETRIFGGTITSRIERTEKIPKND